MNQQQIFDKVATHLLTQGDKAMENNQCKYRTKSGLTCAVGCLIPDNQYHYSMEGRSVTGDLMETALKNLNLTKNLRMLGALQMVHDSKPVATWKQNLREVAQQYHLNRKVLTQFP